LLIKWKWIHAFTLVELLCTLLLGSVISGSAIAVLSGCIQSYEQVLALTEARRRGEMVLQILRLPAENAGFGIPFDPAGYQSALCIGKTTIPALYGWIGPVSVQGNELRLVYAVPTSTINEALATETMPSEDRVIRLSAAPQAGQVEAWSGVGPSRTRSWVVFAPSPCPFLVTSLSNQALSVRSARPSWIAHGSSLSYLRALRALVVSIPGHEPAFCTEDMTTGSGLQERVLGISGFKSEFDPETRVLTLKVLSRGGKRHPKAISPVTLQGWPGTIPEENRHYVLSVSTWTYRIRNGGETI
jgi:prepilin-type N-terminal cleavage/methylation domain-containing protein